MEVPIIQGQLDSAPECPQCGATLDGFTGVGNERPSDGDFTICAYCVSILRFTDNMGRVRLASDSEIAELKKEVPHFDAFLATAKEAAKKKQRGCSH